MDLHFTFAGPVEFFRQRCFFLIHLSFYEGSTVHRSNSYHFLKKMSPLPLSYRIEIIISLHLRFRYPTISV
jgi:hypothetical protein